MTSKLYVGNLPFSATEEEVKAEFSVFGGVVEVKIIMDRETGRSRGFAFVTMSGEDQAFQATEATIRMNNRLLCVSEARERTK